MAGLCDRGISKQNDSSFIKISVIRRLFSKIYKRSGIALMYSGVGQLGVPAEVIYLMAVEGS